MNGIEGFVQWVENLMIGRNCNDEFKEMIRGYLREPLFIRYESENNSFEGHFKGFLDFYVRKSNICTTTGVFRGDDPNQYMYTRLSDNAKEELLNIPTGENSNLVTPQQVFRFMVEHMDCEKLGFAGI